MGLPALRNSRVYRVRGEGPTIAERAQERRVFVAGAAMASCWAVLALAPLLIVTAVALAAAGAPMAGLVVAGAALPVALLAVAGILTIAGTGAYRERRALRAGARGALIQDEERVRRAREEARLRVVDELCQLADVGSPEEAARVLTEGVLDPERETLLRSLVAVASTRESPPAGE